MGGLYYTYFCHSHGGIWIVISLFSALTKKNALLFLQETAAVCCEAICNTVIKGADEWKIGRTKIFLKVQKTYNSNHVVPQLYSIVLTQRVMTQKSNQVYL